MYSSSSSYRIASRAALLLGIGALAFLAGCYTGPERTSYRASGSGTVIVQDDYDYYPGDEVYYNNTRHVYVYREGNSWVNRPQPPHGWVRNAPSVRVDFHDAPERHHADVVKSYPRNWRPAQPQAQRAKDNRPDDHGRQDNDHH
ncbi:MAG: hypothetical protein ABI273_09560 [Lacunisphaera sp.]